MAQQNINPGSAPILWSSVDDAFKKINTNFTELYLSVSGGGTAVDLESLSSNLIPSTSGAYDLGSTTKRWRDIYLTGTSIDLGGALITSPDGVAVNLPTGSTIGGSLIRNPSEGNFTFVAVSGQTAIQADSFSDTLNIAAGNSGILLTTTPGTDTLTISNSGVTLLTGTTGQIGVSGDGTGSVTLTNLGVTVLTGTVGQIGVSGDGTGAVTLTNLGVTKLVASTGINISPLAGTGEVTITNSLPAGPTFRNIAVANQLTVEADNTADTLTLVGAGTVSITTNNVTDTITFTGSSTFDLKGSVFGDDSTKIVDAVENKVYADFFGNLTGNVTGNVAGNVTGSAGSAGVTATVDITNTNGLTTVYYPTFVENRTTGQTVRADVDLTYRTDTNTLTAPAFAGNLTGTVTGNIFTSLIDSSDSSAITVTPATIFSSDVVVENDLNVTQRLLLRGSRVINLTELKSVVAASISFADFQTKIAALV